MKKKILIGIIAVITVICAFSFTACNDECDHQWTDASCTAPKTCSICQETEGQANGHSYKTDFDKNESQHWYECSVCGDKKDAAEHTFNVPAATEQTDKYCTVCNYIAEYQLGHIHTYDTVLSYDEEGHYYAATCGHTELKKDFAFHSFSTNTVAPTCTEQGYTTHTCDCGKVVKDEYTAASGHQFHTTFTKDGAGHWFAAKCIHSTERKEYSAHNYVATVTEPTCTAQGYTTYTCACGDSYVSDYVDAKGHSVATWTEDSCELYDARSCKHEVVYSGLCSGCQTVQTKTEYIEIHAFTEKMVTAATCISEGTLHKMCKNESCKYFTAPYEIIKYTDVNAHNWVKDAQNSSGGVTAYKCNNSACTATKKTVTGGESASVPKDTIGTIDEIKLDNATIGLDEDIKNELSKTGADVSISAGTLDGSERETAINNSNLTKEQKELLGKNKIYNFTLNGGDVEKLGGDATIRIPYNLAPGEDPDNIIVWYVKAGKIVPVSGVYTDDGSGSGSGYVTFTTDHFSYYTVTTLSPEKLCQHLGHDLKNAHTVLPTCTDIGYTLCLRCGNQVENSITAALGHSWQTTVISESSCSESGVTEYCCSVCELSYETVIAATGHYFVLTAQINASCAESGSMTYDCLYCTEGYSVTLPQLSHSYVSKTVAPTCEERGYTEKTCTGCGDTVYVYYTPALGHTPDTEWHKDPSGHYHVCITCGIKQTESAHVPGPEATEQSAQICTVCEYVIVPQLSHTHSLTKVDGTPADCVNLGNIEYYTCVCGKWFTDAAGTQLITDHASVIIDAKGHTYESLPYVEPTCTAVGYTAGVKCSVCETLIRGHVEISAHGHNYIITETAPSCTEAGKITEVCSYCDDAKPEKTVDALGHKYISSITAPTCTEDGYTTFTCARCNDSKKDDEKDALGHNYAAGWLSDKDGHWHECSRCHAKADGAAHTPDRPAATEEKAKTCSKCGYVIEERLNHVHSVKTAIDEKAPTCTAGGNLAYYICDCGEWFYDEDCEQLIVNTDSVMVKPLSHKLSYVEETEPDCTEVGYTAGYYCDRCKTYLSGHEEIPATGHSHSNEWSSDESEHWHECACGDKADKTVHNWNVTEATEECAKYCTVCEYVAEEKLPHTHKFNNWIDEIPASCTEEGTLGHYECPCGKLFNENKEEIADLVIPKENHSYSDEWLSDENEHWHECACGDKADKAAHSFVDGKCEACERPAKTLYTYVMESAYGKATFTFAADGSLTVIGWEYSSSGEKVDFNEIGTWTVNSNGEIEATARELTQLFIINSDGTLALKKTECTHEHKTIETVDATCENPGYEYTKCSDCGNIVGVQTIPALGHNYDKVTGICGNCGQSEGGQGGEEETEVLYTYVLNNDYVSLTYSFMSDYTFTIVGNATSDGKPTDINETGTWTIDSEGYLAMTLYGETQLFIIGENGELTPKQNGGTNVGSVYMYTREERNMYLELYFMSDGTLTMTGWRINENDAQEDVFEEGTWFLNKDGYVEATMYGETMLFVIGKDGMLTPKDETGDEPEVTESYNYTVNHDYADMGVSFWSDNSFTAKGWYIDENDEKHDVDENGTWQYINDNTISAYICGDNRVFEIDSDGNLTLKDNEGDEPEQPDENVRYTYYIDTDDESLTLLFMSDKTLTVTGWRFNANGEKEKVNYSGTWSINEATNYVEAVFNGKKLIFTQLGVSDLMFRGEGYISDSEEITTLYTYTYKTDAYDAILTFMSDQTLIASGWRLTAEGMKAEPFTNNGGWYIDGEGFIVADIGANYGFFILGADGSLTLREDCTHEKTDTNIYGLSCLTHGYEETYCLTCYSVVSSRYVEPSGHKYESGVCTECGANESDPAPKELYTYNPKNENGSYVLSFLDNFIFSFTLTEGYFGEGIEQNVPYYGTWSYYNDTTIETTIFGESFETLTVNEDGTLSEYQCKHENTYDDTIDAGCDEDGYIRIYCDDCGEVISDTPIPATGHVYENGHCVNCGRAEDNKPEIEKTVVYVYNDGSLSLTLYNDYSAEGSRRLAGDSMVDSGLSFIPLITGYWEQSAEGNEITVYTLFKNYIFSVTADGVLTLTEEKEVTCSHEKTTVSTVAPSCETNGCRKMYCDACGDLTYVALIPATGHNFINGKCESCGEIDKGNEGGTDEPGEACSHKKTTKDGVPATCLLSGYEFYICLDCYSFVSEEYLDPTGHNFGEDGICTECGANESDPEPKELYKYEYANAEEGIKYVMSFLDNGVFTLNMLEGQVEEGIEKDFFAGEWYTNEDGTISAYLFGNELYRFTVGEDGTLSEYECKHENTYESKEEPGCDRDGVKRVFCEDCGMLVSETSIPATGHNFNESGYCPNCGQSNGSGGDYFKKVEYFYSDTTLTLTFYSDYSVDGTVKTPSANGMSFMQKVFGSWSHNYASGGISVQLNTGEKLEFEIANGKDLVLVGQEGGDVECKHEGELVIVTYPATCTEWGYRMENCPSCGYTVNKEEYEPLGHDFNENGVCLACGEKESEGELETLYTYTLKKENLYAELIFMSDYSATAKGWYINDKGEKSGIDEDGNWWETESGKIELYFYGDIFEDSMYFTVNEDASLTLYECPHENSITEGFDATCILSGYKYTCCGECGDFISEEYLDPTGHSFDEEGICTECGANESAPEPKELYKYEYVNAEEGVKYVMSLLDNDVFTLNMLEGQIEEGNEKDFFVGEWYTNGDGTISALLFGNELYRFTVGEDGTLSKYECKHKKTFESSESATCEKDGIIITICYECYREISSTVIPAIGHNYGDDGRCTNCGYSENGEAPDSCYHHDTFNYTINATCTLSGISVIICGNCSTELSEVYYIEPTGHSYDENGVCSDCGRSQSEPEPTEVYSFVYKDEYTSYNFSFMSDNTYYFTGDERTADGNVISQSFYATWSLTEDGTILDAYLLDEPFISFEVDADGKLTMIIPSDDEIPADCSHANTYDETEEPVCNKDGYTRIYCGDCGLLLSDMPISSKGHSYDDNGICINCGYSENKEITVTPGYGYDLAA